MSQSLPLDTIKTELVEVEEDSEEELKIDMWLQINQQDCHKNDITHKNLKKDSSRKLEQQTMSKEIAKA